jgi:hypothetical protein
MPLEALEMARLELTTAEALFTGCHESQSGLEIAVSPQVTNINCRKSLVLRCHNYKLTNISSLASVGCVAKAGQGGRA